MPRKRGRQDKGGAGQEPSTPATADAPILTTPPRSCVAVETPATPATPELKRAKTHAEAVAKVSIGFWREQAMKKEDERFLLQLEVGELKEALSSSEAEVAKLKAELVKVREEVGSYYFQILSERSNAKFADREKEALMQEVLLAKAEVEGLRKTVKKHEEDKAEVEAERERRSRVLNSGMQSEMVGATATGTQTARRTYASVVAQTEDTGEKMNIDGPSWAFGGDGGRMAGPTTKEPAGTTPVGDRPVRAFVVHGVACSGQWAHRSREIEKAFGCRGGGVIGMRWLLQWGRRRGRSFTSMVVYLRKAIPTTEAMYVRVWGRRHRVEEYQWDRQPRQPG